MDIPMERKRIARRFFKEFCTYNTLHGVRYFVVRVRHWSERLWWLVAILLSLCLSALMIHSSWLDWQEHPTELTTTNEMDPASKMPYPTVMICPPSRVVRDKFDLTSKFESEYHLLPNVSHADATRLLTLAHMCKHLLPAIPFESDFADEDIFKVIQDVAPTVEEITLSCSWKGAIIKCSEYLEPVMTIQGVCFTFNGLNSRDIYTDVMAPAAMAYNGNPNVFHWSMEHGYEYEFGKEEYPIRVSDSDESTTLEINLVIDEWNSDPYCRMALYEFSVYLMAPYEPNMINRKHIGATLSEDTHIHFAPKLTTTSNGLRKYSPSQRQCYFQSERQLRLFKTYSERNCLLECWANVTKANCGCVDFSLPRDKDTKMCGVTKIDCYREAQIQMARLSATECDCLPSCTSMEYSWEIEQLLLNLIDGKHFNGSHRQAKQKNNKRQARLRLTLQKSEVKTMELVERVTVIDFLVVCGGILGLFMGFSVMTIVELIYYPLLRLYCTIQRMKEEDKERQLNPNKKVKKHKRKPRGRLQSYLLEYCNNSSIHGLRYFSLEGLHFRDRCYWAISCVVSFSLCCWMTYNVWSQWQLSPVLIRPAEEIEDPFTTPLPTITICPGVKTMKHKFDVTSALNNLSNLSRIETQRMKALTHVCPLLPNFVAFEDRFANESIYNTIQDIAQQFEDTLLECRWKTFGRFRSCSTRMTSILTDEGLCFAFNALNSHDMYTNEMTPGMMMVTGNRNISHWSLENGYEFGYHRYEYPIRISFNDEPTRSFMTLLIDKRNFDYQCNHFDGGFKLSLTQPGEVSKMSRNYLRIHLKNFHFIDLEAKVTKTSEGLRSYLYTPDQRRCFFQSERRLRFFRMYTEVNCEEECLANFMSLECGCVHFSMPRDNKTKICGAANFKCLKAAREKFLMDEIGSAFHSECNCLPACVSIQYKADVQRSPIRMKSFVFHNPEDKGKDIAMLRIAFKKVETDERVERFTVIDFLAYCGGLLGIHMGISVLSIVEIIYFATLRLFLAILQWKSENSVTPLIPWL